MRRWVTLRRWGRVSGNGDATATTVRNINHTKDLPCSSSSFLQDKTTFLLRTEWKNILQQIENGSLSRVTPCFPRMVGWRKALVLRSGAVSTAEPLLAWAAQMPTSTFRQQPVRLHRPACGHLLHLLVAFLSHILGKQGHFDNFQCPQASVRAQWLKYLQHEVSLHFSLTISL